MKPKQAWMIAWRYAFMTFVLVAIFVLSDFNGFSRGFDRGAMWMRQQMKNTLQTESFEPRERGFDTGSGDVCRIRDYSSLVTRTVHSNTRMR